MSLRTDLSATLTAILLPELRRVGRYHLPGFGSWTLKTIKARRVRNPVTKELMWLPGSLTVRFRPAKRLRKAAQASVRAVERRTTPEATQEATR